MPAPTALQRAPEPLADEQTTHDIQQAGVQDDTAILNLTDEQAPGDAKDQNALLPITGTMDIDEDNTTPTTAAHSTALFAPETLSHSSSSSSTTAHRREERKIRVPPHRLTPLKAHWAKIYPPLVEHLHLQVRMNVAQKAVELRTSRHTTTTDAVQKGADFLQAFMLGFDLDDAIALLRLDDLYIQTFEVRDVKPLLAGEHLSRAVGRVAGKDGKTKFAIENASRTRIVLADQKVHILGGFRNIGVAREAVVSLILGSPPGKVYGNLRTVSARMKERF